MLSTASIAQMDKMFRAQECLKAKDVKCAKQSIDSVFLSKEAYTDPQAWYFRAFVYYELAKKDKFNLVSADRDSSISYAKKGLAFKPDQDQKQGINQILKQHSSSYFNLCKKYLEDSVNYEKSLTAYANYKKLYSMVDSSFSFKAKDIEFYSAAGSQFTDLFNNNSKPEYGEIGKVALMKVLDLDPKNIVASVNLGIIYYNQGVNLINSMDIDTPLDRLEVIQDNSAKLFKQSLPFMNRVYELDPQNVKALESLSRIYHALNDDNKATEFNNKLEQAKQGK